MKVVLLAAGLFVLKWSANYRNLLGNRKDQIEIEKTQPVKDDDLISLGKVKPWPKEAVSPVRIAFRLAVIAISLLVFLYLVYVFISD